MVLWVSLVCFTCGLQKPYTLHTPVCFIVEYGAISLWWLLLADKGAFRKYCSGSIHTVRVAFRHYFLELCLQWFTHWPTFQNPSSSHNLIIHIFQFFEYLSIMYCIPKIFVKTPNIIPIILSDRQKKSKIKSIIAQTVDKD